MSLSSQTHFSSWLSSEQNFGNLPSMCGEQVREGLSRQQTQVQRPEMVLLDFQHLKAFEQVTNQYQPLGVRFEQAIALSPSNPAFAPRTGSLALMPLGHHSSITVTFLRSSKKVGAYVSNVRAVTLTAYDENGKVLGSSQSYPCSSPEPGVPLPQQLLELEIEAIAYVTFQCDAPFILNNFFYLP